MEIIPPFNFRQKIDGSPRQHHQPKWVTQGINEAPSMIRNDTQGAKNKIFKPQRGQTYLTLMEKIFPHSPT